MNNDFINQLINKCYNYTENEFYTRIGNLVKRNLFYDIIHFGNLNELTNWVSIVLHKPIMLNEQNYYYAEIYYTEVGLTYNQSSSRVVALRPKKLDIYSYGIMDEKALSELLVKEIISLLTGGMLVGDKPYISAHKSVKDFTGLAYECGTSVIDLYDRYFNGMPSTIESPLFVQQRCAYEFFNRNKAMLNAFNDTIDRFDIDGILSFTLRNIKYQLGVSYHRIEESAYVTLSANNICKTKKVRYSPFISKKFDNVYKDLLHSVMKKLSEEKAKVYNIIQD